MSDCMMCGAPGVEGVCSMCYGDIDHGSDNYYREWAEEQQRRADEARQEEPPTEGGET